MAKKKSRKQNRHVTDLANYPQDVEKFERYVREHVRTKEDVDKLLSEFDEQQKREWEKHTVD